MTIIFVDYVTITNLALDTASMTAIVHLQCTIIVRIDDILNYIKTKILKLEY